jgi:type I protein arginine methyltransferase
MTHALTYALALCLLACLLVIGPFSQYTHWKQTVFYLDEVLLVTEGDTIEGKLSCQQNKKNKRDLDIVIEYTHESKYGTVSRSQQFFLR